MTALKLPLRKPVPWGNLGWLLPLGYVFWDPYQSSAAWAEWFVTSLSLAVIFMLFLLGLMWTEEKRITRSVCGAVFAVAVAFFAYRPSGGIYFPLAAAFVPFAVSGSVARCVIVVFAVAAAFLIEWWLLYADTSASVLFPVVITAETVLVGAGMTYTVQQTHETRRFHKASERERIARDLHDVLGHTLSSLAMKAELARRIFHADPQRALAEIGDVERIARAGLEEVREAIHGYHSGDICAELDRVESLLKASDIAVERRCEKLEMSPAQERVLALILREAATNILRHSQAKSCRLALFRTRSAYRLEVSDDGRGGCHEEGLGMSSIRARAAALGGDAVWSSTSGTRLCISLPIVDERSTRSDYRGGTENQNHYC